MLVVLISRHIWRYSQEHKQRPNNSMSRCNAALTDANREHVLQPAMLVHARWGCRARWVQ